MVLYLLLLIALRLIPRRTGNIMTPFEFILLFLLGGIGMQSVIGDDRSLVNAVLGVMSIGLLHLLVSTLKQRYPSVGRMVDGTPVVVFEKGEWQEQRMNSVRIQEQDVMAAARQQGIRRVEQFHFAVVERNGSVSVFKKEEDED